MSRLEPISPRCRRGSVPARALVNGRMRHAGCEVLGRHSHARAFAAVVLSGTYVEAGDSGRYCVSAGDVIVHRAYESHLDRIGASGAEVIVVPVPDTWNGPSLGRLADPDGLVRIAERSLSEAASYLVHDLTPRAPNCADWTDLLAEALRVNPSVEIAEWARLHNLHPGSLSRGFERQFGTTPARFRTTSRAHRAIRMIVSSDATLSGIAADCGYADQAHMCRGVRVLTGQSPAALRRISRP